MNNQSSHNGGRFPIMWFTVLTTEQVDKTKAMAVPFPMFKVMPTGGISLKTLGEYAACPTIIACGGSCMCPGKLIEEGKWREITELCRKSVKIVKEARKQYPSCQSSSNISSFIL